MNHNGTKTDTNKGDRNTHKKKVSIGMETCIQVLRTAHAHANKHSTI